MDILKTIQQILTELASKGRHQIQFFKRLLDKERQSLWLADVPPREAALGILGISEKDLKTIEEKRKDIREFIRKRIAESSPSFGRFMTQAYLKYDTQKTSNSPKIQQWEDLIELMEKPETLREADILSLVIQLYLLHREQQGNPKEDRRAASFAA